MAKLTYLWRMEGCCCVRGLLSHLETRGIEGSWISTSQPVGILLPKDTWQYPVTVFWLSKLRRVGEALGTCVKCEKARNVSKHPAMLRNTHSTKNLLT